MLKGKRIIIVTGGTGGHIFPARALAEFATQNNNCVTIMANKNYVKYHKLNDKFSFNIIPSSQIHASKLSLIKSAILISLGILKSLILMIFKRPDVVIAFGGYATFPVLISAIILRKKIILHEQNAHLGKVNRIFARYATIIALSFKKTDGIEKQYKRKTKYIGNPVRESILKLSKEEYKYPNFKIEYKSKNTMGYKLVLASDFQEIKNLKQEYFNILVIGGSGGAKIFSDILPKAFFNIRTQLKNKINIIQQCRSDLIDSTHDQYKSFNLNVTLKVFFEDIDEQIRKSHLVISRSGSSTISELTIAKKPMILVPFANSTDNHQLKNAKIIEENGGAIIVNEEDFTINNITKIIEKMIDNPNLLNRMSKDAFSCANIKATSKLLNSIINFDKRYNYDK